MGDPARASHASRGLCCSVERLCEGGSGSVVELMRDDSGVAGLRESLQQRRRALEEAAAILEQPTLPAHAPPHPAPAAPPARR